MKRWTFLLILLGLFVRPAWALDPPPPPDRYVSDAAGLLSPAIRQQLEEKLAEFEGRTSNQVLVATFPQLQGESIEEFAIRLAEKWKPGQKGRDNGVILIVSKGDRAARIEVGYGLEGALPDAIGKAILENEILPAFRRGDYDAGIQGGVDAILRATAGEYRGSPARQKSGLPLWAWILLFILLYFLLSRRWSRGYQIGSGGSRDIFWGGGGGWRGGGWGGGGSSSGGGFSGGGGSFGGGGASGRW